MLSEILAIAHSFHSVKWCQKQHTRSERQKERGEVALHCKNTAEQCDAVTTELKHKYKSELSPVDNSMQLVNTTLLNDLKKLKN